MNQQTLFKLDKPETKPVEEKLNPVSRFLKWMDK